MRVLSDHSLIASLLPLLPFLLLLPTSLLLTLLLLTLLLLTKIPIFERFPGLSDPGSIKSPSLQGF